MGLSYEGCINWLGDSNGDDQEGAVHSRPEALQGIGDDEYSFGFCASPLWQDSPSPPRSPSQPLLGHHTHRSSLPPNSRVQAIARGQKELHNAYRSLSPNSRVQAIVRGQRELMEMVKNMPESSYELSLKDLVENDKMDMENQNQAPAPPAAQEETPGSGNNTGSGVKVGQKIDKNMKRSGSFEHKGLFLKMGLPVVSLQKRSNSGGNNNDNVTAGKAPPKPVICERDWWKKKFTSSSDSDSSRTSNTSGSTRSTSSSSGNSSCYGSRRKKDGFLGGCWPFFQSRRKYA